MPPENPRAPKLFPRNLTARANRIVLGNPASSRPESGVDNCYPGLEFDKRTLDQCFFPGLRFEYHSQEGAVLIAADERQPQVQALLNDAENEDRAVFLWALHCGSAKERGAVHIFQGQQGIHVWRTINALPPGLLTIVLGLGPPPHWAPQDIRRLIELDLGADARPSTPGGERFVVTRAERSAYLDQHGVIDPDDYPPGDLTKTLCAPWMYDFRDCFCYYWAANKPDLVTDGANPAQESSFLRNNRSGAPETADVSRWDPRVDRELTKEDMVHGSWNDLPVVLDNREQGEAVAPPRVVQRRPVSRPHLIRNLRHLATIEHALMVEYLFARYSLRIHLTDEPDPLPPPQKALIGEASNILLGVAVDEMRHMRWVNLMLRDLGEPPSLGRARIISEAPKPHGDPDPAQMRPVQLRPLTAAAVQDFVDAERHSDQVGMGLDGLYVHLLIGVTANPEEFAECRGLAPILKLIIDEGADHFRRFVRLQEIVTALAGYDYLRIAAPISEGTGIGLAVADIAYAAVIDSVGASLCLDQAAGDPLLAAGTGLMRDFDQLAIFLAAQGAVPRFRPPRRIGGRDDRPSAVIAKAQLRVLARIEGKAADPPSQIARTIAATRNLLNRTCETLAELGGGG